jgi:hypothetical protein
VPSAALLAGQATIPSQLKAVEEFCTQEATKHAAVIALAIEEAGVSTPIPLHELHPPFVLMLLHLPLATGQAKKCVYVEDSNNNQSFS